MLHSFGGNGDGGDVLAGLMYFNGKLYGTTLLGGPNCGTRGGCGTVFAITPSGTETLIHNFSGGDGANPEAGLISVKGTLYGTTAFGGDNDHGTVFAIPSFGSETVLHSFASGSDGAWPNGVLIHIKGTLYGTTSLGGDNGLGTVFSLTP